MILVGSLRLIIEDITAVKTTYSDVRKAETEGSISSKPIICVRYATNIKLPNTKPSSQICLSVSDVRARRKKISIIAAAIANLARTKDDTTPLVPSISFSSSRASNACFIQMNVAPQTRVTANSAIIAIFRCLSELCSMSDVLTKSLSDMILPLVSSAL